MPKAPQNGECWRNQEVFVMPMNEFRFVRSLPSHTIKWLCVKSVPLRDGINIKLFQEKNLSLQFSTLENSFFLNSHKERQEYEQILNIINWIITTRKSGKHCAQHTLVSALLGLISSQRVYADVYLQISGEDEALWDDCVVCKSSDVTSRHSRLIGCAFTITS